jgi:hypothetical protein
MTDEVRSLYRQVLEAWSRRDSAGLIVREVRSVGRDVAILRSSA